MKIFKSKWFSRFARQNGVEDQELCIAITRAERGFIDANLGGHVINQRIARTNQGKSGGFRSIILFRIEEKSFFIYGFPKNQRENITIQELKGFKKLAKDLSIVNDDKLLQLIEEGEFTEVKCHDKNI